jgi:hypothetical protein
MKILSKISYGIHQISGKKVNQKIFFLHFPKCGGTSINKAIRSSFGYFERPSLFHLNPQASLNGSIISETDLMDYREKILLYCMSNSRYKYISGHFRYSDKAFREFGEEWHFITILRHPVKKWLSHYFFNKHKEDPHFRISESIEDFLNTKRGVSLGCDYVSKLTDRFSENDLTSDDAIHQAIANLKSFSLVGVLEDTDNFAKNYHKIFDAKLFIEKKNYNPLSKTKQQEEITNEIKSKIEAICQPNMRIYESVLKKIQPRES